MTLHLNLVHNIHTLNDTDREYFHNDIILEDVFSTQSTFGSFYFDDLFRATKIPHYEDKTINVSATNLIINNILDFLKKQNFIIPPKKIYAHLFQSAMVTHHRGILFNSNINSHHDNIEYYQLFIQIFQKNIHNKQLKFHIFKDLSSSICKTYNDLNILSFDKSLSDSELRKIHILQNLILEIKVDYINVLFDHLFEKQTFNHYDITDKKTISDFDKIKYIQNNRFHDLTTFNFFQPEISTYLSQFDNSDFDSNIFTYVEKNTHFQVSYNSLDMRSRFITKNLSFLIEKVPTIFNEFIIDNKNDNVTISLPFTNPSIKEYEKELLKNLIDTLTNFIANEFINIHDEPFQTIVNNFLANRREAKILSSLDTKSQNTIKKIKI